MLLSSLYYVLAFDVSDPPADNAEHSPIFKQFIFMEKCLYMNASKLLKLN